MMIKVTLDVSHYCDDCPFFSPETSHVSNGEGTHLVYVACKNKNRCTQLINFLESKTKKED